LTVIARREDLPPGEAPYSDHHTGLVASLATLVERKP
jgi:hypothetical protein